MTIEKLTPEQEAKIPEYKERWIKVGESTEPADFEKTVPHFMNLYKAANRDEPELVIGIRGASPLLVSMLATKLIALQNEKNWEACKAVLLDLSNNSHEIPLQKALDYVADIKPTFTDFIYGNHDGDFLSFFEFLKKELDIDEPSGTIKHQIEIAKHAGWWAPFEKVVLVCDRPCDCHIKDERLHRDGGPALAYKDKLVTLWSLNGVNVPKEIAETPAMELNPGLFMTIDNAEVRREFVRKVGIERIVSKLPHEKLDAWREYELLGIKVKEADGEETVRKYLKMENPSLPGVFHIEGVSPHVETVADALDDRKPEEMRRIPVDDVNGEDWMQQGDVVFFNPDAKSLKRLPKELT